MAHKKPRHATFAQIVAEVPEPAPSAGRSFSYTIPMLSMTGDDGAQWRLRSEESLEGKALQKALQADIPVFFFYAGQRTMVSLEDREGFWQRATAAMAANRFSDFQGYEYEDDANSRYLVIYESC